MVKELDKTFHRLIIKSNPYPEYFSPAQGDLSSNSLNSLRLITALQHSLGVGSRVLATLAEAIYLLIKKNPNELDEEV